MVVVAVTLMESGCVSSRWMHAGFARVVESLRPEPGALALAALLGAALGLGVALLGLRLRSRVPEVGAREGVRGVLRPREERPQLTPPGARSQDAVAAFALKAQVVYPINQRYQPLISGARDALTLNASQEVGSRQPKSCVADEQENEELEVLPGSVAWARHGGVERRGLRNSGGRRGHGKGGSKIGPRAENCGVVGREGALESARTRQGLPGCLAEVLVLGSEELLHSALYSLVQRSCESLRADLHRHRCVLLEMMLKELLRSNGELRMHGQCNEEMGRPDHQEDWLGNEGMDESYLEELGTSLSHSSLFSSWFDGKSQRMMCRYLSVLDAYLLQLQDQAVSVERETDWLLGPWGGVLLDTVDQAPVALIHGLLLGELELAREAAERAAMLDERMLTWERAVRARVSTLKSRQHLVEAASRCERLVPEEQGLQEEQSHRAREAVRAFRRGLFGLQHEFERRWQEESTTLLVRLAERRENRLAAQRGLGIPSDRAVKSPAHACSAPLHRRAISELVQRWQEKTSDAAKAYGGIENEVDVAEAIAVSQLHESLQGELLRALDLQMEEARSPSGPGTYAAPAWLCRLRQELRETRVDIEQWCQAQEEREDLSARKERDEERWLVTLGRQRLQEREASILSGILRGVPGLAPGAVRRAELQSELWVSLWSSALWVPQPLCWASKVFSQLPPVIVNSHVGGLQAPHLDAMQRELRQDVVVCGHIAEVARATREDLRLRTQTLLKTLVARDALAVEPYLLTNTAQIT